MNTPNKESNRSMSWRPLLLKSGMGCRNGLGTGGARRVVKSMPDMEYGDHLEIHTSLSRTETGPQSRKRSSVEVNRVPVVSETTRVPSLPDSPSVVPTNRNDSKRHSSASGKSSLVGEEISPLSAERRRSDPKNLRDRVTVNGKSFIKLKKIGTGGSCVVYRVLDEANEIFALKCVNLANIPSYQYNDFVNEVKLLEQLRGSPGIINMIDYELRAETKELFIV